MSMDFDVCIPLLPWSLRPIEYKMRSNGHARELLAANEVAGGLRTLGIAVALLDCPDPAARRVRLVIKKTVNYVGYSPCINPNPEHPITVDVLVEAFVECEVMQRDRHLRR